MTALEYPFQKPPSGKPEPAVHGEIPLRLFPVSLARKLREAGRSGPDILPLRPHSPPPPRAFQEMDPPRLHSGNPRRLGRPEPRTHLRLRHRPRPEDQGQLRAQPPTPAEAAASEPTIRRARSKRGVAPEHHPAFSLSRLTLLIFILAFTRQTLFKIKLRPQMTKFVGVTLISFLELRLLPPRWYHPGSSPPPPCPSGFKMAATIEDLRLADCHGCR